MIRLTNNGKEILAKDNVIRRQWKIYGELFHILKRKKYVKEKELLPILESWAKKGKHDSLTVGNWRVDIGVFYTHRAYIRGITGRREFGDVTFITAFSSKSDRKRVAYANAFQIKVGNSAIDAYRGLFSSTHLNQLNFYRRKLIEALHPLYNSLICDFLHYWLIGGGKIPHPIMEVPLSFTWLGDSSKVYSRRFLTMFGRRYLPNRTLFTGMDTVLRSLFLITGINVKHMLRLCTPSLRKILEKILSTGIRKSLLCNDDDPMNEYLKKNREKEFRPEFPIASSLVIATEVVFLE